MEPRRHHRAAAVLLVAVALAIAGGAAEGSAGGRVIAADGVRLVVPSGWLRIKAASVRYVSDPVTVLVVGTAGVRPQPSQCQIAAYRIPTAGAVVVVVRWRSVTSAGGAPWSPGRAPLKALRSVHRPSFECFSGRGAVADVLLGGHPYQINVMVGKHASTRRVAAALTVARSFAQAVEGGPRRANSTGTGERDQLPAIVTVASDALTSTRRRQGTTPDGYDVLVERDA